MWLSPVPSMEKVTFDILNRKGERALLWWIPPSLSATASSSSSTVLLNKDQAVGLSHLLLVAEGEAGPWSSWVGPATPP